MATVQEEILKTFYAKLAKSGSIPAQTIEALRKTLSSTKKLKAEDIAAILAKTPDGGTP